VVSAMHCPICRQEVNLLLYKIDDFYVNQNYSIKEGDDIFCFTDLRFLIVEYTHLLSKFSLKWD